MAKGKKDDANSNGGSPSSGHNKPELTEDERRALTYHHLAAYQAAQANLTVAKSELKAVSDKAKGELGKHAIADIKELILLAEPKAGQALRADIERKLRLARWANTPVGTQFTFSEMDVPPTAFELGKTAGLKGEPKRPPFDPGQQQYDSWCEGWNEGQQVNLDEIREKIRPMVADEDKSDLPPEGQQNTVDVSEQPFAPPAN